MEPELPLISVIIPAYQAADTLAHALDSVLLQDYPAFEVLVVDDGSTDATSQVAARYAAHDSRVRCFRQANQSPGPARNFAVERSSGQFLAFLDADDAWQPGKLGRQVEIMAHKENIGLVFTDALGVDGRTGRTWLYSQQHAQALRSLCLEPLDKLDDAFVVAGQVRQTLLRRCFIAVSSVMLRRDIFQQSGGFRDPRVGPEDVDLWIRIAPRCEFAYCASSPLTVCYQRGGSLSHFSESWLRECVAFDQMCLASSDYSDLRAEARQNLRRHNRLLVFYWGRRGQPLKALAAYRSGWQAGFDGLSALCALGSLLGPLPFRLAGRILWP